MCPPKRRDEPARRERARRPQERRWSAEPGLAKRLPDSAPLFETATTFQVRCRGAESNPTPRRSPIRFRRTPERAETAKFVQPFEREAERDLILLSVRLTAPAHLRRRASAQPVVNEADAPGQTRAEPTRRIAPTLHPFTTGCM